jgi:hypothetical protein
VIEELEGKLDSLDSAKRKEALLALCEKVGAGEVTLPSPSRDVNLHCHTFFSYNSHGYSPSKFAWLARKSGLAVAGIVDFDVLDGLEEFLEASRMLGLKGCAGMETRVFVPEFANKVITSPGEPGITYHMGVGFPRAAVDGWLNDFLFSLKKTAQERNLDLIERVNKYLNPVELDYKQDVIALTPAGNPTERHISLAWARKARKAFADQKQLAEFWTEKLGVDAESLDLPEGRNLLNAIRAKTMKQGGVGYVRPDAGAFPKMEETNKFILAAGGIPTLTWLDGTSDGEKEIEKLLEIAMRSEVAAINTIPDRNYTPGVKDEKLANLYQMAELAEKLGLPVVVGTEMNSPGQKFVDDFDSRELSPLRAAFLKGAYIVYAHSVLQQRSRLGYTSDWAKGSFENVAAKNEFFEKLGRLLQPQRQECLDGLSEDVSPQKILEKCKG